MGKLFSFDFNDAPPQEERSTIPPEIAFSNAIMNAGFACPDNIVTDSSIHRYGKKKENWYVFFWSSNNPGGAAGNWQSGKTITWSYRTDLTKEEQDIHNKQMAKMSKLRDDERKRIATEVREEVQKVWNESKEVESHPYLTKKNIKPHGVRLYRGSIIVPMRDIHGNLHSLQRITATGEKFNWAGGAVSGYFHTIQGCGNVEYLVEGLATGATIHEATGATVYIAFSANNLVNVSKLLNNNNIVVAGDNDYIENGNNVGLSAALATGRRYVIPSGNKKMDFNDLAAEKGLDEVRRQLNQSTNKYTKRVLIGPALHVGFLQTLKMGWTVDKILPESSALSVIFGPPSGGKSFTALDLCCSIDSGTHWHGRKVKQRPVLYLAAEGQAGILRRIEAWKQCRKVDLPTFALLPMPCLIDEDSQRRELINMITELPQKPGIIVLDTLARSMTGDENSTSDMGKVVIAAGILIEETGAQVIIIHHTGKDEARGPRGAIALTGATDSMFKVVRLKEDKKFVLLCERQKDDEPFTPMVFRFNVVDTGFLTVDGLPVTSLVPEFDPEGTEDFRENGKNEKPVKHSKTQEKAILALDITIRERGIYPPPEILDIMKGAILPNTKITCLEDWKNECLRLGISSGESRAQNKTFQKSQEQLEKKKIITILSGYVWKN
ncbi:MAG: AAA family ATPase [Candidatus Paceibacterota bacterium]|jgi:hypothetical protein